MQFLNALKKYSDSIFKETAGQESSEPAADAGPAGQESSEPAADAGPAGQATPESTVFAMGKSLAALSKPEAGEIVAEPEKAGEMVAVPRAIVEGFFTNALKLFVKEGTTRVKETFTGIQRPPVNGFDEILKWNKEEILRKLNLKEKDYKKDENLKQLVEWVQKYHPKKANVQPSWIHKLYIKDGKIEECGKFLFLERYYDKNYIDHCITFKPEVKNSRNVK